MTSGRSGPLAQAARGVRRRLEAAASLLLRPDYSLLSIRSDRAGWVIDIEAQELLRVATGLGIRAQLDRGLSPGARQCVHYGSQFVLEEEAPFRTRQRVSLDYFHGVPRDGSPFAACYQGLRRHRERLHRVRVSHAAMRDAVLAAGLPAERTHLIPIGVRPELFPPQTADARRAARASLDLPQDAPVVGSFQKDGVGWGAGEEPKPIKGPDVLVEALRALHRSVPELHVLLAGPARGYVRRRLAELGIPWRHEQVPEYARMGGLYQALDVYLVASREEGGPKAVLEAMSSGVPLVSTRVGQARDLLRHGENGLLADVEDAEGLAHHASRILGDAELRRRLAADGRRTAEANSLEAQRPLWRSFFQGYVEGA